MESDHRNYQYAGIFLILIICFPPTHSLKYTSSRTNAIMKTIIISFCLIFSSLTVVAQADLNSRTPFLELNLLRYSVEQDYFVTDSRNEISIINGFKFGLVSGKREAYVRFLNQKSTIKFSRTGSVLRTSDSYQLGIGINQSVIKRNRLTVLIGAEVLLRHVNYEGDYIGPVDGLESAENVRTIETGLASNLQLNYKIFDNIYIVVATRVGIYYYNHSDTRDQIRPSTSSLRTRFDPVNSFGLRFDLFR